jgi:large subunit ribosomal protein L30
MIIMAQASSEQRSVKAVSEPKLKQTAAISGIEQNKDIPKKTVKANSKNSSDRMFAVVLVRSFIGARHDVKKTLISLRLHRKNACIVRKDTPELRGMLTRAKDFITWGEIDNETYDLLSEKRGKENLSEKDKDKGSLKPFFRLNPPKKGFGRKGIKISFSVGGGLGYRKDKMNDLIMRMI